MATIKATCSCGGSFETEGSAIHCGLELTKFLDAHKECNKDTPAPQQSNKADGKSDTPCSFCHGELTLDPCPLCGN